MLNLSLSGSMHGSGKCMVKRPDGSIEVHQQGNQLLSTFFTRLYTGVGFSMSPKLKVGTGTTPSDTNTTQLAAVLPPTSGTWPQGTVMEEPVATLINGGTTVRAFIKYQFIFAVGAIEGNISEYGLNVNGDSTTTSGLVDTRILLTDVDGQPTTITLGSLDQFIVEYTIDFLIPYADVVTTISAVQDGSSVDYEMTLRHGPLTKFSNYMSPVFNNQGGTQTIFLTEKNIGSAGTGLPQATDTAQGSVAGGAAVGNGAKRSYAIDIPTAKGNLVGGIAGMCVGNLNNWYKIGFNPPLPKVLNNNIKFDVNLVHAQ